MESSPLRQSHNVSKMKIRLALLAAGSALCFVFLCAGAADQPAPPLLPAEVPINPDAGRGGLLIVTLTLESGEQLPFVVDTGTSGTMIDISLASKLGKPIGTARYQSWGVIKTNNYYTAPKLFLGGAPLLMTGPAISTYDFKMEFADVNSTVMGLLGMDVLEHYCIQLDFTAANMRFLPAEPGDKKDWGQAFPIVALNANDPRPAVAENLLGLHGPHSLIDIGCNFDGWLMTNNFQRWTNHSVPPAAGEAREPYANFAGARYPQVFVQPKNVESDGIGLHFFARHLVTLDFPHHTLYLARKTVGPLPSPGSKATALPALDALIDDLLLQATNAMQKDLAALEHSHATEREKTIARKLTAALVNEPKPVPAAVPPAQTHLSLGDARPETAEVGWLEPAANYIPLNAEVASPLLDSGKIYTTGLYAHAPSRYIFNLGGGWNRLRGEAGLHTAFQGRAFGVIFVIQADSRELFRSPAVRDADHVRYDVNVKGVKTLELIVEKAGIQNGGNWALWLEPELSRDPLPNSGGR